MTVRRLSILVLLLAGWSATNAQDAAAPAAAPFRSLTPSDKIELGVDLGLPFVTGDLDPKFPGFGAGLHVRKAFDHIFSARISGTFASSKNEGGSGANDTRESSLRWISGNADAVITLNNIRFNKPNRKVLLNVFGGVGIMNYNVEYSGITTLPSTDNPLTGTAPIVRFGAGLAYRISPKFNIGLEYGVANMFGRESDLLDGEENVDRPVTTFRDIWHFPHLQLNFNLGKNDKNGVAKSEPLYWINPMTEVANAIAALEARPIYDPTDTDGDGIIDAIDDEDNSPAGARVDAKGVTLDSDMDKVPDYKDKEPFSPPGYTVDAMGVAQVPKPITEADVNRIVDAKLANFKLPATGIQDWFLPGINFADNSFDVRYNEYEKLSQVATVLKNNPSVKVVAVGHTDDRGSERYNNVLSYNRAKAAIDILTTQYGISRDRIVLNWSGEGSPLVPAKGSTLANRRVEFRVAKGETEMARPEGPSAGKGRFSGNKDAGY